jgi:hypothetical protein
MEKVYDGAASLGSLYAKATLAWSSVVAVLFIGVAAIIVYYNYKNPTVHVVDEKHPVNPNEKPFNSNWIALILFVVAVLIFGSSYYKYWLTSHSTAYAAVEGSHVVTNAVSSELRNLGNIKIPALDMSGGYFFTETEL